MNIRTLPKVELHCHLEACFRPATVREIGRTLGIAVPPDEATFRRDWLITQPMTDLAAALRKFSNIQAIWGSEEAIERLAYEACLYGHEQNIRLFELRYSPDFIAEGHPRLTFERIHCAVLRGVTRANRPGFAVGLIGIVRKILTDAQAAYTTDFIIENRDSFVALDFADRDIGFRMRRFAPLIERARSRGLHFTTHSGEDKVPEASAHVRMAIEELGAERIGHGIHAVRDPGILELAHRRNVMFEFCPTSNWLTSAVRTIGEHPIRAVMESGVHVSINSDDPALFGIDLNHEYEALARDLDFTQAEFERINDLAAAHSFLPIETKRAAWPRALPEIARDGRPFPVSSPFSGPP